MWSENSKDTWVPENMGELGEKLQESSSLKLSLAVHIIDSHTGKLVDNARVSLRGVHMKSVKNPSGYYLFFDVPEGICTIQVNGGEHFFDEEKCVKLSDLDGKDPVVNITLKPTPSYPFSASSTLIRGFLKDSDGRGLPDTTLKVKGTDIQTRTNGKGDFIICFTGLKKEDVTLIDGKKLVRIKEKKPVLVATHPDYGKMTRLLDVEEGNSTSISIAYS